MKQHTINFYKWCCISCDQTIIVRNKKKTQPSAHFSLSLPQGRQWFPFS